MRVWLSSEEKSVSGAVSGGGSFQATCQMASSRSEARRVTGMSAGSAWLRGRQAWVRASLLPLPNCVSSGQVISPLRALVSPIRWHSRVLVKVE